MINSYGKIYNLGHAALKDLFTSEVSVEEKIDGSQFSFGKKEGVLFCRSKNQNLNIEDPQTLFWEAVETAKELFPILKDGWTYRGEYLKKARHNVLAYDRIPNKHIIIFDIDTGNQSYLTPEDRKKESDRIGLECIPVMFYGMVTDVPQILKFMDSISCLGGQKIEGLVFKNHNKLDEQFHKILMGKHVSEEFKEVQAANWKVDNPKKGDIIESLVQTYKTPARWNKAIQHLKESGNLTDSPKDISFLIKEVIKDVHEECEAEIKEKLYQWAYKEISRKITRGLPEWYKNKLIEKQFEGKNENEE